MGERGANPRETRAAPTGARGEGSRGARQGAGRAPHTRSCGERSPPRRGGVRTPKPAPTATPKSEFRPLAALRLAPGREAWGPRARTEPQRPVPVLGRGSEAAPGAGVVGGRPSGVGFSSVPSRGGRIFRRRQNCTAPGEMLNMAGSNFWPRNGEPSVSQPFFSIS